LSHWCTMVHGPCRGKACDFWARVKLKHATVDELLEQISHDIFQCAEGQHTIDSAIDRYWKLFGLSSLERLGKEEPELFEKVREVSIRLETRLRAALSGDQGATHLSNHDEQGSESSSDRDHVLPVQ
jgi:hypothetical protein